MGLHNRAQVATATVGTGTVTLGAAKSKYQDFASAGVVNSEQLFYLIEDGAAWEVGRGTYTTAGTTLTRTLIQSSTGALLNLSGAAVVSIIAPAEALGWNEIASLTPTVGGQGTQTFGPFPTCYQDLMVIFDTINLAANGTISMYVSTQAAPSTFSANESIGITAGGAAYHGGVFIPNYMRDQGFAAIGMKGPAIASPGMGSGGVSSNYYRRTVGGLGGIQFIPNQNWASGTIRILAR